MYISFNILIYLTFQALNGNISVICVMIPLFQHFSWGSLVRLYSYGFGIDRNLEVSDWKWKFHRGITQNWLDAVERWSTRFVLTMMSRSSFQKGQVTDQTLLRLLASKKRPLVLVMKYLGKSESLYVLIQYCLCCDSVLFFVVISSMLTLYIIRSDVKYWYLK